ncbi:MAG TPA: hypothetical protein VGI92_01380 [Gemmatimonadales bacterium]|jgi:hypothetical protein
MLHHSIRFIPFALYVGPDVLMPLASAVAAVVGFLLMFWKRTVAFFQMIGRKIAGLFSRK